MLWLLAAAAIAPVAERPNIILILSDDHARQAISAYGSRIIDTPGIDRLASEGSVSIGTTRPTPFARQAAPRSLPASTAMRMGTKTTSPPSTGRNRPFRSSCSKAAMRPRPSVSGTSSPTPRDSIAQEVLPGQGLYHNPDFLTPKGRHREEGYVTDLVTDKALKWLNGAHDKPFFLMIGHKAPIAIGCRISGNCRTSGGGTSPNLRRSAPSTTAWYLPRRTFECGSTST